MFSITKRAVLTSIPVGKMIGVSCVTGSSSRKSSNLDLSGDFVLRHGNIKPSDRSVESGPLLSLSKTKGLIVWQFYLPANS